MGETSGTAARKQVVKGEEVRIPEHLQGIAAWHGPCVSSWAILSHRTHWGPQSLLDAPALGAAPPERGGFSLHREPHPHPQLLAQRLTLFYPISLFLLVYFRFLPQFFPLSHIEASIPS